METRRPDPTLTRQIRSISLDTSFSSKQKRNIRKEKQKIFKDLNGNDISDPRVKINAINTNINILQTEKMRIVTDPTRTIALKDHKEYQQLDEKIRELAKQINKQPDDKINYQINYAEEVVVLEYWNAKAIQENASDVGEIKWFETLSEEECNAILKLSVEHLQKIIRDQGLSEYQGAAMCCTVVVGNQIFIVWLGDNLVYLYQPANPSTLTRLNEPHIPNCEKEFYRIKEIGGRITKNNDQIVYLEETLTASRLLGHDYFLKKGLEHIAEVRVYNVEFAKPTLLFHTGKGFLQVDSDNYAPLTKFIKQSIELHFKRSPSEIANNIYTNLENTKIKDNISLGLMYISSEDNTAKYMGMFTGYHGCAVSQAASYLYQPILQCNTLLKVLKDLYPQDEKILNDMTKKIETFFASLNRQKNILEIKTIYENFNDYLSILLNTAPDLQTICNYLIENYVAPHLLISNINQTNVNDEGAKLKATETLNRADHFFKWLQEIMKAKNDILSTIPIKERENDKKYKLKKEIIQDLEQQLKEMVSNYPDKSEVILVGSVINKLGIIKQKIESFKTDIFHKHQYADLLNTIVNLFDRISLQPRGRSLTVSVVPLVPK